MDPQWLEGAAAFSFLFPSMVSNSPDGSREEPHPLVRMWLKPATALAVLSLIMGGVGWIAKQATENAMMVSQLSDTTQLARHTADRVDVLETHWHEMGGTLATINSQISGIQQQLAASDRRREEADVRTSDLIRTLDQRVQAEILIIQSALIPRSGVGHKGGQ